MEQSITLEKTGKGPNGKWKVLPQAFNGPPPPFFNNRFIVDRKAERQDT